MSRLSTRLLLTCTAIGIACGLLFIPVIYSGTAMLAAAPWAYGLVAGCYLLPGVIAQALFRRGGIAIVTATIGGIVAAPFVPGGIGYVPVFVLVGALQELPFLIVAYRYWRAWVFLLAAAVFGIVVGTATLIGLIGTTTIGVFEVLHAVLFVVGFLGYTALGLIIARGLDRTGAARGVQRPVDRRKARPAQTAAPATVER